MHLECVNTANVSAAQKPHEVQNNPSVFMILLHAVPSLQTCQLSGHVHVWRNSTGDASV